MQPAQAVEVLLREFLKGQPEEEWAKLIGKGEPDSLWEQCQLASQSPRSKCMILLPVHSQAPQHWSLLGLIRKAAKDSQEPNQFQVRYLDSLQQPSQNALEVVAASLQMLARLVQPAEINMPGQPLVAASARSYKQADQYSCGYWTLRHAEVLYRLYRGEGWRAPSPDIQQHREQLNKWLFSLDRLIQKRQHQEQLAEVKEENKQKLAAALAAAAGASGSTSLPQAPLPDNSVQQDCLKYGCSKCRHCPRGCLACNPAKAAKYGEAKVAESQP